MKFFLSAALALVLGMVAMPAYGGLTGPNEGGGPGGGKPPSGDDGKKSEGPPPKDTSSDKQGKQAPGWAWQ